MAKKRQQEIIGQEISKGQLIGYARVSTADQNLDAQFDELIKQGCNKKNIYQEKMSGAKSDRPELKKCLDYMREGDTLVITKLDRLARSLKDLIDIINRLESEGKNIQILDMGIDTATTQGRLVYQIFGAIAEFERALIKERTQAGLNAARARGHVGGRKVKMTPDKITAAKKLLEDKSISPSDVAKQLGISRATLYKHLPGGK
jgi:DNA invertase Pin-like site-specific DNA recombinase